MRIVVQPEADSEQAPGKAAEPVVFEAMVSTDGKKRLGMRIHLRNPDRRIAIDADEWALFARAVK